MVGWSSVGRSRGRLGRVRAEQAATSGFRGRRLAMTAACAALAYLLVASWMPARGQPPPASVQITVQVRPTCTLTVQSTPITGINITGTPAGTTNYHTHPVQGSQVSLTAPASVTRSGRYYAFVRWKRNSTAQRVGNRTLSFIISQDTQAVAIYKYLKSVKVTGPTRAYESSTATYVCKAYYSDGSYQVVTASARWGENSMYARFTKPGVLKTYGVPADRWIRVAASFHGGSASLSVKIVNRP